MDRLKNLLREAILGPPQPVEVRLRYRGGNQAHWLGTVSFTAVVSAKEFQEAMVRVQRAFARVDRGS